MCFNIQSSQWDDSGFYINVGIVIIGIDDYPKTALGKWHIFQRINEIDKTAIEICEASYNWLEKHCDLAYLKTLSNLEYKQRLPIVMTVSASDYLKRCSI